MQSLERLPVFKTAILKASSTQLEEELLGVPLWLRDQGLHEECLDAMEYIGVLDPDLFYLNAYKSMVLAYKAIANEGLVPTNGRLRSKLQHFSAWSDEPAKGMISPETITALVKAGKCLVPQEKAFLDNHLRLLHHDLFDLYRWRQIVQASESITNFLRDRPFDGAAEDDIGELIGQMEAAYCARTEDRNEFTPLPINFVASQDVSALEKQLNEQADIKRVFTPFTKINTNTGGFLPGNLVVIAGRTSMGKTGIGLDIGLAAARKKAVVIYFSLEMSNSEIARRIAAKDSGSNVLHLRAMLNRDALENYRRCLTSLAGVPFFVDDRPAAARDLEERCERLLDNLPAVDIGLLVVDHLQLLGASDKIRYESRHRQLSTYVYQLKDMAKRLKCPIVALSQVNRLSDREKRPPRLSDLRESGAIEETADIIFGLYRKAVDDATVNIHDADCRILKNRNGPVVSFSLFWSPETATFHDAT